MRILFTILVLLLVGCAPTTATQLQFASRHPTATPRAHTIIVTSVVAYVYDAPDGKVIGKLFRGDIRDGTCGQYYCRIVDGLVWRGCTNSNPQGLGCKEE